MPSINWNESSPAGADSAGLGAQEFRSLKTAIRTGLDGEHNWPSAGGDAGVHRLGSGRPFYGTQSAVSSSGTDGRLMLTSDTSRLFGVGSSATAFIGGATVISAGSYPGAVPQRHIWVEEWGIGQTKSGTTTITFPNSGYSGAPFVQVTGLVQGALSTNAGSLFFTRNPTATSVIIHSTLTNGASSSSESFFWRSVGSRVL